MKIAVIGPGAVGSYYGAKLARAGHAVHFLLRSHFEHLRRHGVSIRSPEGDFNVRPKCAQSPDQIGPADLVLVALKATANSILPDLLPPLVGPHTAVVTLQNGLGNEECLASIIPAEQILGGLCFVCLHRPEPGLVQHTAHGKIELGEFQRWPEPRTHDIATALRHAGVPCAVRDTLERARWEKLAWNIPFNGLGVASCAGYDALRAGSFAGRSEPCRTTDLLLEDSRWHDLVRTLMHEVIRAGNAFDLKIPLEFADELIEKTRVMGAYKPSTLVDFLRDQPVELDALFLEPLRRAETKNVPTPQLRALCDVLTRLNSEPNRRNT